MKKTLLKVASSVMSVAMIGTSLVLPADAEMIYRGYTVSSTRESLYFINLTPQECDEYKIYNNYFGIDPDDTLDKFGYREYYSDPSLSTCMDANIYPNKYNVVPPTYVSNRLITQDNGYYKYRTSSTPTFEIESGVFPDQRGICYSVMEKIEDDELLYLYLPLDAADIPIAEAFIEADDREGLYDFIVEKNAYVHPYFGELNPVGDFINRDFTWAEGYNPYPDYTTEQIYQWAINYYVYPSFQPNAVPTSAGAGNSAVVTNKLNGDDMGKAAEFIETNDRTGLYDFLCEINDTLQNDKYFKWCTTNYTGSYVLDDESYNEVLQNYVLPEVELDSTASNTSEPPVIGDTNMDGRISIQDIIMINKISSGIVKLGNYNQAQAADVDGSCVINADDINLMTQYLVDLIDDFS